MIRPATFFDAPAMLDLGERMHAESTGLRLSFSRDQASDTLRTLMTSEAGFVWVAERNGKLVGFMLGAAFQQWFTKDVVASELALYVSPAFRGTLIGASLVKRFTSWARGIGAKQITSGISTGVDVENTAKLYEALGYSRFGVMLEVA